jgi:hypothetical protein
MEGPLASLGRSCLESGAARRGLTACAAARFNIGFFAAALLGCVVPEIFHQSLLRAKRRDEKEASKA